MNIKAIFHDSSTTGGSSGSPVFEIATGRVIGVHFGCDPFRLNHACPIWKLKNEPILKEIGIKFA